MKLCVVILSGAADLPIEALGDHTPLESARLPALAAVVERGRVGGVVTIPRPNSPSHEVALCSILAVDPLQHPPEAGALLAVALGPEPGPTDRAFRCDLVNVYDGAVVDPTAGTLGEQEAMILVSALQDALGSDVVQFSPGDRWRALLTIGGGQAEEVRTSSPASILGEPLEGRLPTGPGCELLKSLQDRAVEVLADHEINTVRVDLGENPANAAWIWGGGRRRELPGLLDGGTAVGHHPSFLGLASEVGLSPRRPERGDSRSGDLAAIGEAALEAMAEADLTVVHVEGPLELSRLGEVDEKVRHLEEADARVVAPLAERLVESEEGRLMVVASHVASVDQRLDLPGTVPFVMAGAGTVRYGDAPFTEAGAAAADLVVSRGHELMEFARR
ncbi:MAG: alkaline phosphatase family protein [Planctomycetota bacterium]|jgi:2,3-bisphosphoglycerate-independent phosphoglycerate mutase